MEDISENAEDNLSPAADARPPTIEEYGFGGLFSRFLLIPLTIVAIGVGLFLAYSAAIQKEKSTDELLATLSGAGVNKPWHAAFELTRRLAGNPPEASDPVFIAGVAKAFEESGNQDPRVRSFLAMALANLKDRRSLEALQKGLEDESDEIRIHVILAIGLYGDPAAAKSLTPFLDSTDEGEQRTAICALGLLKDEESLKGIVPFLEHETDDLRWNAALALAGAGDMQAEPVLLKMLDRDYLKSLQAPEQPKPRKTIWAWWNRAWPFDNKSSGFDEAAQARVMKHAMAALAQLQSEKSIPAMKKMLESERQDIQWEAAKALATFSQPEAAPILEAGLDRRNLMRKGFGPAESKQMIKDSIRALGQLKLESSNAALEKLKETERDPEILKMADQALKDTQ
ncbi:MAG: HEAT repeat domain-containing protein [Planctomycetota bacterium]|jgi:HEAT repeat protein|nr:HEAT repeat domain-containing protein [Planctomycetota bacterium]